MYINTQVVRALMALRRIDEPTLANIANVSTPMLSQWLYDETDASEDLIAFDTQLEILRVLGINGETPRNDIVHYWYVHEPLFSSSARNYWALAQLTQAFGKADAVYFAKDADPLVSVRSKAHFGLQFASFKAVLEVTSHPLRNIGFDPALIGNMQWAPGNFGVLVDQAEFEKLAPGLMTPVLFDSQLNVGRELLAWERLNLLARERNISADHIEQLLLSVQQGLKTPKLPAGRAEQPDTAPQATTFVAAGGPSPEPVPPVAPTGTVRPQPDEASLETPAPAGPAPQPRRPSHLRARAGNGVRKPWPAAAAAASAGTLRDE